jgi:hypothetical protein
LKLPQSKEPLGVLLRKCLILATRLKNNALREWSNKELNGYSNDDALPEYRTFKAHSKGHFVGPFGAEVRKSTAAIVNAKQRTSRCC